MYFDRRTSLAGVTTGSKSCSNKRKRRTREEPVEGVGEEGEVEVDEVDEVVDGKGMVAEGAETAGPTNGRGCEEKRSLKHEKPKNDV